MNAPLLILLMLSVPSYLLRELAEKAQSLVPIMKVIDLYDESGMIDELPVRPPVSLSIARVSSPYGYRKDPITGHGTFHTGIDYACSLATSVVASASGEVVYVGEKGGYGKCIIIQHRYGFRTLYAHLAEYYVRKGVVIPAGKVIGFVGTTGRSTGYHVHFEVRKNNLPVKPFFYNEK